MRFLRQSTQIVVKIGPFLDKTDGVTEETGLATTATEISKSPGGAFAAGPTLGTHDAEGYYPITLTTTHTDTVGELIVKCHDSATHLPVWEAFYVLEEAVFDALFAASALGYVANASVNVAQFGGINGTFSGGRPEVNTTHWKGTAPLDLSSQRVQAAIDTATLVGSRISLVQQVFVRGQPLRVVKGDAGDIDHETQFTFHWDNPPTLSSASVYLKGVHRDDAEEYFAWDGSFETISATRTDIHIEHTEAESLELLVGTYDCRLVVTFSDGQEYTLVVGSEGSDRYVFPMDVLKEWEHSP